MKGTKGLMVIALLLVVLAAVSAGCAKSDTAVIEDTITVYFNAWNAQNYDELESYIPGISELSEQEKAAITSQIKTAREMMGEITFQKIENIVISDSTATANVTITIGNMTSTGGFTFMKEDGIWKILPPREATQPGSPPGPPPGS
ncbi:MAG: hypothetical protein A2Y59_00330 [Chloroflexi bacterium RBG_13_52_14]|nr:MAG: hypothetical protein A2Y59_00330 [Chloroflexi bacterium RBG_13_52_14]